AGLFFELAGAPQWTRLSTKWSMATKQSSRALTPIASSAHRFAGWNLDQIRSTLTGPQSFGALRTMSVSLGILRAILSSCPSGPREGRAKDFHRSSYGADWRNASHMSQFSRHFQTMTTNYFVQPSRSSSFL